MLKQVVVFCAVLAVATAFLERMHLQPIPEKYKGETGCYIEELDVVVPFGKAIPSKARCVEYRCDETVVTIAGCGKVVRHPPQELVERKELPYPQCCPTLKRN